MCLYSGELIIGRIFATEIWGGGGGGGLFLGGLVFYFIYFIINFFFLAGGGGGGLVSDFTVYFITGTLQYP